MTRGTKHRLKIWSLMIVAVIVWSVWTGVDPNLTASDDETYKGLKLFTDVLELVERNYVDEVDGKKLIENAIQGMLQGLDPHSTLLPPEAFKELQLDTQGEFTGIGVSITMRDGFITVISPIDGTPAYRAGIKAGDRILKVDGETVKDLRDAVNRIRGPKGTKVTVTIGREGIADPMDFTLVRDVIPIESVRWALLKPGFGYVWITNFRENTTADLKQAIRKMEPDGKLLKGLILDLRDNPGGLLNQAIDVSDLFLDSGKILSIKGRLKRNTKVFKAHPGPPGYDFPIVVLINGGSASASEIVAGALQDHKRALIMGTTSFGKGSVQNVEALRDGYGIKLTIARYYTPNDRSIQAKGIEPDIVVEFKRPSEKEKKKKRPKHLKEKDLRNHLEAEPPPKAKKEKADKNKSTRKSGKKKKQKELTDGTLSMKRLRSDNQITRALDVLVSFDIFGHIRK